MAKIIDKIRESRFVIAGRMDYADSEQERNALQDVLATLDATEYWKYSGVLLKRRILPPLLRHCEMNSTLGCEQSEQAKRAYRGAYESLKLV